MHEMVIALLVGTLLLALAATPPHVAIMVGLVGALLSIVGGIVFGAMYHLHLLRAFDGKLPPRWWWNPMAHHHRLQRAQLDVMAPWFFGGVASFCACVVGLLFVVSALLKT